MLGTFKDSFHQSSTRIKPLSIRVHVCVRNLPTSGLTTSIYSFCLPFFSCSCTRRSRNFERERARERERKSSERARSSTGCCLFTTRATITNLDNFFSRDRNRFSNTHYSRCLALCIRRHLVCQVDFARVPSRLFSSRQYRHTDFSLYRSFVRVSCASPSMRREN